MSERQFTASPLAVPPAYFQVARTQTIHRVRAASQMTCAQMTGAGPRRETWVGVRFWCHNLGTDQQGSLSSLKPYTGTECLSCLRNLARHLGRSSRR